MLGLVALFGASSVGDVAAAAAACVSGTPRESLCNVEPELRRSYLLIEQVEDLAFTRERIANVVRGRHVSIVWDWNDLDQNHLGAFRAHDSQVVIPAHVRGQPAYVEAAILAHELWHAHASSQNLYPATVSGCLENERAAFMVGVAYYHRLLEPSLDLSTPRTDIDARMFALDQDWQQHGGTQSALESLAGDHLARNGYHQRCARYPSS